MIEVYFFKLDGCGHCDDMKSVLNQVKSIYNISIKEIEHNDKHKLSSIIQKKLHCENINAYPELKLINNTTNKVYTYSGPRTVADIHKWIKLCGQPINTKTQSTKKQNTHRGGFRRRKRKQGKSCKLFW